MYRAWLRFFIFTVFISLNSTQVDHINSLIKRYDRPITVLGITNDYELIISLAQKYKDSCFVWINSSSISSHGQLPSNFIHLQAQCNNENLKHLSECEHFDVVYIEKNNFSELNDDCANHVSILYNLGENVLISLPLERDFLSPCFLTYKFSKLERAAGKMYFYSNHSIEYLSRSHWNQPFSTANAVRHIISTYKVKILCKKHVPGTPISLWLPGINMMTFKHLNGQIPSKKELKEEINRLFNIPHLDWMPNNMVVQGDHLALIDFDAPGSEAKTVHTPKMLNLTMDFVLESDSERLIPLFDAILDYCRDQIHPDSRFWHW